ncbi:MAG: FixH family protein [Campylobacterales bacterium]|nr:FixH family protein [Campylobacterales bacterium]
MKNDKAMRWPYGIALSFVLIIGLIYGTIVVSLDYPVEQSDDNLQNYHVYDKYANGFIQKQIEFDRLYQFSYIADPITPERSVLKYKLTDKEGVPLNNATIKAMVTRPDTHQFDIEVTEFTVEDGIYTSAPIALPKEGRWNIIAHVVVNEHERYLNLKADTRYPQTDEY